MVNELRIRQVALTFLILLWITSLSITNASAECWICFGGSCYIGEGNCDGFCSSGTVTCEDATAMINPVSDYLLATQGHVYLVQGDRRFPMISDNFAAFISKMNSAYPKELRTDPKVQKKIEADFAAFRKKKDPGTVSKKRLATIAKESRLKIRELGINESGVK